MPDQKHDPSPRTIRRWCIGFVFALLVQSVVTALWAVDPFQRAVSVGWSLAAAALMWRVFRLIPNSPVRPVRSDPEDEDRVRYAFTVSFFSVVPVTFGALMKEWALGDSTGWLGFGVRLSSGLAAIAAMVLMRRWFRRRRRFTAR